MTYKDPMEMMLEAFGARAKYEAILRIEDWQEQSNASTEYQKALMDFAVEFEKGLGAKEKKLLVNFSLRDRLMRVKGQQTVCHTYRGLLGTFGLKELQHEAADLSNRLCLPFDTYVYG